MLARPESTGRRIDQPSLVQLASDALRDMILSGELAPGDRLVEDRLTQLLGISRAPLREAMRLLEREGLVQSVPRKGSIVTPLTDDDISEISTMRSTLERMAIELGVPVVDEARLQRCHAALEAMTESARREDRVGFARQSFEFHLAVVALAGHRRLVEIYRSLCIQMYIVLNNEVRERLSETLEENVERHRRLLGLIESGDREAVLAELEVHGDRTLVKALTGELPEEGGRSLRLPPSGGDATEKDKADRD
jgi:DNA-binding GntR family transcriptional regulator